MKPTKDTSKFEWEETGSLKIRYDSARSATLRYFPSDKVIAQKAAKFTKKSANHSKRERNNKITQKTTPSKTALKWLLRVLAGRRKNEHIFA